MTKKQYLHLTIDIKCLVINHQGLYSVYKKISLGEFQALWRAAGSRSSQTVDLVEIWPSLYCKSCADVEKRLPRRFQNNNNNNTSFIILRFFIFYF